MLKILICGGNGFIGGRLALYLSNFVDNRVICLSRKKNIYLNERIKNVYSKNYKYKNIYKFFEGVDIVVHLACMNSIQCEEQPNKALETNLGITENIIKASINNGIKKIIYISTIHVYGKNLKGEVNENTKPFPTHPYSLSHKNSEDFILNSISKNFDATIFRLSNAYGPPVDVNANCWNLFMNDICKQAIEKRFILLKSDGLQKRNFIQMSDVCSIINLTIRNSNKNIKNQIFNLGGEQTSSILNVAKLISQKVSKKLKINKIRIITNEKKEDFNEFTYSIDKIKNSNIYAVSQDMHELDNLIEYCSKKFKIINNENS